MRHHCCAPRRLEVIARSAPDVNAIEFLEVLDRGAPPGVPPQRTLFVRLLRADTDLDPKQLSIAGGERIASVGIEWSSRADALPPQAEPGLVDSVDTADRPRTLVVRTESAGDFSTYTFAIAAALGAAPPNRFDPELSAIRFSFKVECPSPFDCRETPLCPPESPTKPVIDYLAKDYQSLRRLLLDRMSLLVPDWTERSPADVGVALVELLAFAFDNLSYRQDVVATEAYLHTARLRRSVRRHTRLVDYFLHEGTNARVFVHFQVQGGTQLTLEAGTTLLTKTPGLPSAVAAPSFEDRVRVVRDAITAGAQVFLTAHAARLAASLNAISFYTWGDGDCCLPRGCTRATLRGDLQPDLEVGTFLLLEEILDPKQPQASAALANQQQRWVVRLTKVTAGSDPSGGLFQASPNADPVLVTEIEWDLADALPFPLCLSVDGSEVTVARGNLALADHGTWVEGEDLGKVPSDAREAVARSQPATCTPIEQQRLPLRFYPTLARGPLTHGFELAHLLSKRAEDTFSWPASALVAIDPRTAMPQVLLHGEATEDNLAPEPWKPRRDLLDSRADDEHFVVEMEDDGIARLRFGDDVHGKRPNAGVGFLARYRVGNGSIGNVGAEAIAHVVGDVSGVARVRNPLPAAGGVDPEDVEVARRDAPQAFRSQERAVTAADYAALSERLPDVQRATARFRWTGSWHTAFVTADRFGGGPVDAAFGARLRAHLERFRMAGYDLRADSPRYVPLDLALFLCIAPDQPRAAVLGEVTRALSSGVLPDGRLGLFHPDNFTFGSPVYSSQVIAAAQAVPGVESVRVDRFQRLTHPDPASLENGVIPIGALEIAQLENSPTFPERGRLKLVAGGGR